MPRVHNPMSNNKPYKTRTVKKALMDKHQRKATLLIKSGKSSLNR